MTPAEATPALRQLLRELPASIPVERIDRLWLFLPREVAGKESGLVVLSLLAEEGEPGRRRVMTLRYEAERGRGGTIRLHPALAEQGSAPAERVPRLIEGVIARLGDQREDPLDQTIAADPARWTELLASLGEAQVDRSNGE